MVEDEADKAAKEFFTRDGLVISRGQFANALRTFARERVLAEAKWWAEIVSHHEFSMDKEKCKLCQRIKQIEEGL
jgi:hypothetical protein